MVIVYDLTTKEIISTEDYVMLPSMPFNMSANEKNAFYKSKNKGWVTNEEEIGASVLKMSLTFDETGNFIGLQAK